jgi:hypothetical protein
MKVGLWNQSVSLFLITFEPIGSFHEIWYAGDAIEGDLNMTVFNPIAATILKLLRFKIIRWMHYLHHLALLNSRLGLFSIVGFPWLHIFSWCYHGNKDMYFWGRCNTFTIYLALLINGCGSVSNVWSNGISGLKYEVEWCNHENQGM